MWCCDDVGSIGSRIGSAPSLIATSTSTVSTTAAIGLDSTRLDSSQSCAAAAAATARGEAGAGGDDVASPSSSSSSSVVAGVAGVGPLTALGDVCISPIATNWDCHVCAWDDQSGAGSACDAVPCTMHNHAALFGGGGFACT